MFIYEANAIAIKGCAKAIRQQLLKLGMRRCSLRLVYRQAEAPTNRLCWYELFWRWFFAIWKANRPGAEFLFEDFRSRVLALRSQDDLSAADWYTAVAHCEREHSEALQAAILNRDDAAIKTELSQDIAAKRKLLAMVEARGSLGGASGSNFISHCDSTRSGEHVRVA